ncbi:MAG: NAD(P)/FAD-dependent oxidoreductase [Bdellovibrionales bacterium]|nr:NAD(P)/FAD-dependent oxidoreductase [Bdellovibrionales bacterium]
MNSQNPKTLAVIGAGPAGLFAAHVAIKLGYRVALFESHSKPGGSASFFRRKLPDGTPVLFDAGATVMPDLREGAFLRRLLNAIDVVPPPFHPLQQMHYQIRGRSFSLSTTSSATWIEGLAREFPQDAKFIHRHFGSMALQAERLMQAMQKIPHLPLQNWQDLRLNLGLVTSLLPLLPAFLSGTVDSLGAQLDRAGISAELREWIDMNLLITLQCHADQASPLWAAMALFYYPLGAGSTEGGMKALFEPLLKKLESNPLARVAMRTPVLSIHEESDGRLSLTTAQGQVGPFDAVLSSAPRMNTRALADFPVLTHDRPWPLLRDKLWSASMGYLAVEDSPDFPAEVFYTHSSLAARPHESLDGGEVYMSFSARNDSTRAPQGVRTVTLSTHTHLESWPKFQTQYRSDPDYIEQKTRAGIPLREHFETIYPRVKILMADYATPLTYARYTQRREGNVGGIPLSQEFTGFNSPSQRTGHPRLLQLGDTAFPGQSLLACALGAVAAIEKIHGRKIDL